MSQDVAGVTGAGVEVVFQLVPLTSYSSPRKGLGVPPLALQVLSVSSSSSPPTLTRLSSVGGVSWEGSEVLPWEGSEGWFIIGASGVLSFTPPTPCHSEQHTGRG